MRIIPRSIHGFLDYATGLLLIGLPWFFGLTPGLSSQLVVVMGIVTVLYSLLTNYELGIVRVIPFRGHLLIDALSGVFFLLAPMALNLPLHDAPVYYAIGIFELLAALMTDSQVKGPVPPSVA